MKKLLLQLDPDRHPSAFDRIVAYDAGADEVLSYGGVTAADVTSLVHGAIFTRGPGRPPAHRRVGGRHRRRRGGGAVRGGPEGLLRPVSGERMMDANGCNTTAAAAVARLAGVVTLSGARAVILGGTGPVGIRAAALLAREGATVVLCSRSSPGRRARASG